MFINQIEKLQKVIENSNSLVLVEGKRDREALSKIGISSMDISGKPLEKTVRIVCSKEPEAVSILTDFDEEGKRQLRILTKALQSHGVKINNTLRKQMKAIFNIQKIEELSFFSKLVDGNPFSDHNKIFSRNKFLKRMKNGKKKGYASLHSWMIE